MAIVAAAEGRVGSGNRPAGELRRMPAHAILHGARLVVNGDRVQGGRLRLKAVAKRQQFAGCMSASNGLRPVEGANDDGGRAFPPSRP